MGAIVEGSKNTIFNVFLMFYFTQAKGLAPSLAGTAILLALCVDAVTDPLMGSISDNHHSRWGRRHPFMYAAALPMSLSFYFLFHSPDGLGQVGLFAWMLIFSVLVRVFMTLYIIPRDCMVPELTDDYDERTTLISYKFFFGWLSGVTISQLGYLYFLAPTAEYADGRLNPEAYSNYALLCAMVIFVGILVCTAGTHNQIPNLKPAPEKSPLSVKRFMGDLKPVLANRSYLMLVFASLFGAIAIGFSDVVGLYMNTYFWEFSTKEISVIIFTLVVSTIIAVTLTAPITARFDKKKVALVLATISVFLGPVLIFLRLSGLLVPNGDPWLLPLMSIHAALLVAMGIALGIVLASMITDSVDENEVTTGKRQEGMFMSTIAFTGKATSGLGGFFAGIALELIEFPAKAGVGSVDPDKIFNLGLVVGPGLMGFFLVTLFFLSRYEITRERFVEIQRILIERRNSAADSNR
jgi:GPH family glycoside/pentoside/hexuronide:cation symporter